MEGKNIRRRLAAILAADVAGYSRLMGADEEGTLRRLQAHRRDLIDPKIGEHRGRIVKTTGDGMLVEFSSVVDAVRCAVEAQRGMLDREVGIAEDERIRLRIGINLGDIIIDKDDIFGDGVNVAARLEALAEPDGVCISGTVRDHIGGRLPYAFADLGERSVKNIARPVPVFALPPATIAATPLVPPKPPPRLPRNRMAALAAVLLILLAGGGIAAWRLWLPPSGNGDLKPAPRLSVVVLPFANLSNDPTQDYFVDAITDDLTTDLSRIDGSFVISRTTAFTYKGKSVDVKQIGRDLGVRYVLEGSARRLGEQVEVNAQLIDAASGAHVWADRFNTDRANLAKAQEEIVGRLAHTLNIALVEAAGRQVATEKNPDARDLIMRGWADYYGPLTKRQEAIPAFEKALELDPQSIDARVGLARVLVENIGFGLSKSRDQDMARVEKLATQVIERDPTNAQAYHALGMLRRNQNRLAEARTDLEKAVALDRNDVGAILQLGVTLLFSGEPEAALPHLERALRLTPRSENIHFFDYWLGYDHLLMGDANRAVGYFRQACAALPKNWGYRFALASALGLGGDVDEAQTDLAEAVKLGSKVTSMAKFLKTNFAHLGNDKYFAMRKKTLEAGLRRAGLPENDPGL